MHCLESALGEGSYSQEKVTDIVRDVHCQSHIREVESVTQSNEEEGNDMVSNQLLVILPRLLHSQAQNKCLLSPICRLEQVVELEVGLVRLVWEPLIHPSRIEVPNWRPTHHIEPAWPQ